MAPDLIQTDALPMAAGQPIAAAVADAAAAWLTLLMSGEASAQELARWRRWRQDDPEHERAWCHIERVTARLGDLDAKAAYRSLTSATPKSPGRRRAVKTLLWAGAAGATGLLASRSLAWREVFADYRTGTGQWQQLTLADGSRITLNTRSALDVRFDVQQRKLRLLRGEVYIVTGHGTPAAAEHRPFLLETAAGHVQALGTRFMLRIVDGRTDVSVYDGAVRVVPGAMANGAMVLQAGQRVAFGPASLGQVRPSDEQMAAWKDGLIVADEIRLDDFLAELNRYRGGLLRCDPAIAELRVSGVFPLKDIDRTLATLPQVLPVQVRTHTRYWVKLEPTPGSRSGH